MSFPEELQRKQNSNSGQQVIDATHRLTVLAELEDRIHDLENTDEERFGEFTWLDWLICIGGSFLVPYLVYVWFWP
jgi:hypothetical protein